MKDNIRKEINHKLRLIKKLTKEIESLIDKGDRFIIRAATRKEFGCVDIYDPVHKTTNLIALYERDDSWIINFQMKARGIYQAIKYIPISMISPGSFDLQISHLDDWDESVVTEEEMGEECQQVRLNMLAIFEQYGIKPKALSLNELEEMEEEYDPIYRDGKCSENATNPDSNMSTRGTN